MSDQIKVKQFFILLGDVAIMYSSLYLTILARHLELPDKTMWASHASFFTINFIFWIIFLYIGNLYNLHNAVNNARFFERVTNSIATSAIFSLGFFYLSPQNFISPKLFLLIYFLIYSVLFFSWRYLFNKILKTNVQKENIAIIGLSKQIIDIAEILLAKPHLGYNISFIVDTENKPKDFINNSSIANIPIINNIDSINENLINQDISEIIIASDIRESEAIKDTLYNCLKLNINLVNITRFYENISGKIHLDLVNKMWILENFNKMNYQWFDLFKRIYDIAASLFMLLITLPIWPIVALLVKLDSAGPIFFTQKRLGKNETVFTMIKFRTMRAVDNNQTPTTIGDTRISKLGSFLRKTRIDELPQVLNVLKGDMSIVGPRPERPEIAVGLKNEIPFYAIRMLVKPGITGWDQVSGEYHSPSQNDTLKKLQYDFYYIKNRSLYLELSILLKTIATVLSRNGI